MRTVSLQVYPPTKNFQLCSKHQSVIQSKFHQYEHKKKPEKASNKTHETVYANPQKDNRRSLAFKSASKQIFKLRKASLRVCQRFLTTNNKIN